MELDFYIAFPSEHHIGGDNAGIIIVHRIGIGQNIRMGVHKGFRHDQPPDVAQAVCFPKAAEGEIGSV